MRHPILCLRISLLLLLVIVSIVTLATREWSEGELWLLPYEWVLLLTVTISAIVGIVSRGSLGRRDLVEFILWNAVMLIVAVLLFMGKLRIILVWSLWVGLRVVVIGAWGFVIVAGMVLFLRLRRSRRKPRDQRRSLGMLGKLWFSTAFTLCLLEASCAVLEQLQINAPSQSLQRNLELPQNLPDSPSGEWRLAAIGGSTMLGWPYNPHVSIPKLAARSLTQHESAEAGSPAAASANSSPIVVRNLATAGVNFWLVVNELNSLEFRPHCLLVYSGHNEFYHELEEFGVQVKIPRLILDRWGKCSPTVRVFDQLFVTRFSSFGNITQFERSLIDRPLATQKILDVRRERFRLQYEELAQFCQKNAIPTVWFLPAATEAGFEPNRSILPAHFSDKQRRNLHLLYEKARDLELREEYSAAAKLYRQGVEDFPSFAEFHFRLGNCLLKLQEFKEAQRHLTLARELDANPVRMQTPYRQAIIDVAEQYGIVTIDAAAHLRSQTPNGILDESVFLDDVHPSLRGISILSHAAAQALAPYYEEHFDLATTELKQVSVVEMISSMGLTGDELAKSYSRLAAGLDLRQRLRFDDRLKIQEAERFREIADRLTSGEITPEEVEVGK